MYFVVRLLSVCSFGAMSTDEADIVGDAHLVSEPSLSSASTWTCLHDALRTSTPSSAVSEAKQKQNNKASHVTCLCFAQLC